ncbi:MAG: hypothetical protein KJO55_02955, partial [Gammaproteobacteria bacterium]|nr:hypothetical protein [Gammaproteobacteria bacterium]
NPGRSSANRGGYISADLLGRPVKLNLRTGVAHSQVAVADRFAAIALTREWTDLSIGAAAGKWWASRKALNSQDTTQVEVYAAFTLGENLNITPSLQFLSASGLGSAGIGSTWIFSLRLHATP